MASGRIQILASGKVLRTAKGKIATASACCCGVDCYLVTSGDPPCPSWYPTSYRLLLGGITLNDYTRTLDDGDNPLGTYAINWVRSDTSQPSELCGPIVEAGNYRWPAPWNGGGPKPSWDRVTIEPGFPDDVSPDDINGLVAVAYIDAATDPTVMHVVVYVGGNAIGTPYSNNGVIFHGTATAVPCDLRGQSFRAYNDLVAGGDDNYWTSDDPTDPGRRHYILGSGGYVDVVPCCPACDCPVPLLTSYAADFVLGGDPHAGTFDLVGEPDVVVVDGVGIPPACYYESSGGVPGGFTLERQINPCGWTIKAVGSTARWSVIETDSPVGTYTSEAGDTVTVS